MWRNPVTWLLFVVVLVLAVAIFITAKNQPKETKPTPPVNSAIGSTKLPSQVSIFPSDPVLGTAEAKVNIIEFGDFECIYCAEVAVTIKKVINENPGKIRLVWKDFPIPSHTNAQAAAEAAQCAARQGKFWQYHDLLWQNQADFSIGNLSNLARVAGLNLADFETCLNGDEALFALKKDTDEANDLLISGTPHFYINSQELLGAVKFEDFTRIINVELNKK